MGLRALLLGALALAASASDSQTLPPPEGSQGPDVGMVIVQGAQIQAVAYVPVAQAIQAEAAKRGYRLWVGIPTFPMVSCLGYESFCRSWRRVGAPSCTRGGGLNTVRLDGRVVLIARSILAL
jgi:hypothetical protein